VQNVPGKGKLAEILADELGWVEKLEIVLVAFSGAEAESSNP
jgi:hypothetical protein